MVFSDFRLRLLGYALHLQLITLAHSHHPAHCLPYALALVDRILLQDPHHLRTRQHELYFFHEVEPDGMLVAVDIFDKLNIEGDHFVE